MSASNVCEGCLFRAPNGTELVVITLDCGSARIEGSLSALVLKYRYLMFVGATPTSWAVILFCDGTYPFWCGRRSFL